jgi:hypothetical protein
MAVFESSDQLYETLKILFSRIAKDKPDSAAAVSKSRLYLRLRTTSPATEVNFNGRQNPLQITYGPSTVRPDIELELPAEMLHDILLGITPLKKVVASGKFKVRGPVWKAFVLEDIFHTGQSIYPDILRQQGLDGRLP